MAESLESLFERIANAIRDQDGTTAEIPAETFPERIASGGLRMSSLDIRKHASWRDYTYGESFDPTGMEVDAIFSDGSIIPLQTNSLTFSPSVISATTTAVSVSLTFRGQTLSVDEPVRVHKNKRPVIGVMWDYNIPVGPSVVRLTADTDPNGFVTDHVLSDPIPQTSLFVSGRSPFDLIYPWDSMEEYNVISNSVSHKKGSASFSRSLDTVVKIPEFYYKCVDDSEHKQRYWYISGDAVNGFEKHPGSGRYVAKYFVSSSMTVCTGVTPVNYVSMEKLRGYVTSSLGSRWHIYDYATHCAIELLFLLEYASFDAQTLVGVGAPVYSLPAGATDTLTYHTGKDPATGVVLYRGIEAPWYAGRVPVDGAILSGNLRVCYDPSKFSNTLSSDYIDTQVAPVSKDGYIRTFHYSPSAPWAFIPGSIDNYITKSIGDYIYGNSRGGAIRIGRDSSDDYSGLFYFDTYGGFSPYSSNEIYRLIYV